MKYAIYVDFKTHKYYTNDVYRPLICTKTIKCLRMIHDITFEKENRKYSKWFNIVSEYMGVIFLVLIFLHILYL